MNAKTWTAMRRFVTMAALASVAAGVGTQAQAQQLKTYIIPAHADYTGPLANVIENWLAGQTAMLDWWNDTRGKKLGVKLVHKPYDMHFDTALVARTWPEILAKDKPIVYLAIGGADAQALGKRLPTDKVPIILGGGLHSPLWWKDAWHFSARPSYSHEQAGLLAYLQSKMTEKRPLRIATIAAQAGVAYVDIVNGLVALAKAYPDRFTVVSSQWVQTAPISVVNEVREIAKAKPDVLVITNNTQMAAAALKAMKELNLEIPLATTSHNGLTELASMFPLSELEGDYTSFAFAPYSEPGLKAAEVFAKYNKTKGTWGMVSAQTAAQTLVAIAAIERAIAKVGAANLTGEAVHAALLAGPFKADQFLGLLPEIAFTPAAPFPLESLRVKSMTVRNGKIEMLTNEWLPVPNIPKW